MFVFADAALLSIESAALVSTICKPLTIMTLLLDLLIVDMIRR